MKLNLTRPLVFFDIESTGVEPARDRIVELSLIKILPDGGEETKTRRINPEIPIPPEASAIHGIRDEDVAGCPAFRHIARSLAEFIEGCDLAGYNSNKFDIPLLVEEFLRAGIPIDLSDVKCVDVQNIFHKMEQRTLVAAYKFYCGKDLNDAHAAEADTRATYEVLKAQLDRYPELENNVEWLAGFSRLNRNLDFAGRIVLDAQGRPMYNFGKHKGRLLADIFDAELSYYDWIMKGDFPLNTKQVLTDLYEQHKAAKRAASNPPV